MSSSRTIATLFAVALGLGLTSMGVQFVAAQQGTPPAEDQKNGYPPPLVFTQSPISKQADSGYPGPVTTPLPQEEQGAKQAAVLGAYNIPLPGLFRPYDRARAVAYADQWTHGRNWSYPSFGVGCESSCNDCTNFASQALHNGYYGLKKGNLNQYDYYQWWYQIHPLGFDFSATWSATDWFHIFLTVYPNEFSMMPQVLNLEAGDFFPMDLRGANAGDPPDGIADHIRFVVGYGYTSTDPADYGCGATMPSQTYTLLVDQHCTDRKHIAWNYNIQLSVNQVWPFHVR